jgi:hypothetical protein
MAREVRPQLLDAMIDSYVDWREECRALVEAYELWESGSSGDREIAFAAYRAALDREQQASLVYAERCDRVARDASRVGPLRRLWQAVGAAPL